MTGKDYRCLIIDGRMVAIAERVPASVTGDGTSTVEQLVDLTNADPRRGVGHEKVLTRIKVDAAALEVLAGQGHSLDSVPAEGEMVKLALTGNMSTGGISIDRTFEAHPENVEIAEEAARMVGLDIAGIDFICPDITEPVREAGGAICEVNAAPGFRMHTHPTIGEPQFIAKPVVDMLFPPGATSRIPIIAVTGTNGKTTTSRMISHIFKGMGRKVGMTSTDGVVIDERLVIRADASGPRSARMVLQNPRVDTAVFEVARGGILREGLGYERNDVAVVLNVQPDHLGLRGIDTVEQLADVKAVIVEAVPRDGHAVLNADDPLVREMRRRCSGQVVWFSMEEPGSEARDMIDAHCRRGRQGAGPRPVRARRDDRRTPRTPGDAARLDPPAAGDLQRQGADERAERAGRGRRGVRRRCPAARHPAGPAELLDQLLPLPRPPQRGRGQRRQRHRRLLPQRARHEDARRLRRPGRRLPGGVARPRPPVADRHHRHRRRPARRGHARARARSRPSTSTSASSARTSSLRGRERGDVAGLVLEGVRQAMAEGSRCKQAEEVLDEISAVRHALDRANKGDLVVVCVDKHAEVMTELENWSSQAQAGAGASSDTPAADPDYTPPAES